MKMRTLKLIAILIIVPIALTAQSLDCPSTIQLRRATPPYAFNDLSKSAQCFAGKKYEFLVPLMKGKDYRLSFYASPVFNNKIKFTIIDMNTSQKVLDLPGETETNAKGECVLREYFDTPSNKMIHPFFDYYPASSTNFKVIIDIAGDKPASEGVSQAPSDLKKGCITLFIQDKKSDDGGFK
jgi:hypothetical protein